MTCRGLVLPLCLLAGCAPPAPAQRADIYQVGVKAAQANCVALLTDKEVPRTPAVEEWCFLVLQGRDGCREAAP